MAENYILLERIELNASAASVTFSNIPQTGYTDLKVVVSARSDYAGTRTNLTLDFNGLTTNRSYRNVRGYDSNTVGSVSASNSIIGYIPAATATSSTFGNTEIYIPNYNSTSANKSLSADTVAENNSSTAWMLGLMASLWASNSSVTSITLDIDDGSFVQYSTFSLYGLAAVGTTPVIAPKASGGNITTDGTYWYHTFLTSGTFVPKGTFTCQTLMVGGGGGGGTWAGGGGGAGGLLYTSSVSATADTSYTITVGAGGAGGAGGSGISNPGIVGSATTGLSLTAGGGGYGGNVGAAGGPGGSGGGGARAAGGSATGAGTGNAGGTSTGTINAGGGGGGANAAGGSTSTDGLAGNGGSGLNTYSAWATATSTGASGYYSGGGGGGVQTGTPGTGGSGGGGAGVTQSTAGNAGTATTGGGGGGGGVATGGVTGAGGAGGSGVVIIRYTI